MEATITIEQIIDFLINELLESEEVDVITPLQGLFIAECEKRGINVQEGNNFYYYKYYYIY